MFIKFTFVILSVLFTNFLYAQFGSQQIISNEAILARDVYSADIDGDGNMDVLSANRSLTGDFNIAWYKNLDGLGDFSSYIIIDDDFAEAQSIYTTDIDGDGDIDVLATSPYLDVVVWYENLDGLGDFSSRHIINSNANGAFDVIAVDMDSDGDMDVVSASDSSGIAWYKNDGLGNFSSEIFIANTGNNRSIFSGDLDGDGDLDLVASSSGNVIVYWFENLDGQGNFSSPKSIAPVNPPTSTTSVFAIDLDGDNDLDVLAIPENQRVVWYKNLDGLGGFGEEQIIITELNFSVSVFSTDLDNDGDNDILYTNSNGANEINSIVTWHENLNGLGVFGSQQIIVNTLTSPRKVFSSDIDNDGDMDVLSASQNDDTIAWYENFTILGLEDHKLKNQIMVYPNPAQNIVNIEINSTLVINAIKVYDALGRLLIQEGNPTNQLDVSSLNSGLLFVHLETDKGVFIKKVMKE